MPRWSPRLPRSRRLAAWLRAPGSLSAQVARAFGKLAVQRGYQGPGRARADEAAALGLAPGRRVHVREVLLRCDGRPLVSARSIAPSAALRGPWRALAGLGTRSLAELLFRDAGVRRAPLAYARIRLAGAFGRRVAAAWQAATGESWAGQEVWARHAVYRRRGCPLLVTEVFAPGVAERLPLPGRQPHRGDRSRLAPAHASTVRPQQRLPVAAPR